MLIPSRACVILATALLSFAGAGAQLAKADDCAFVCKLLNGPSVTPPPAAAPVSAAPDLPVEAAADKPAVAKARPKPAVVPVVIAAADPEIAATAALAARLPGHATKIVHSASPAALRSADLTVAPVVDPAKGAADTKTLFREDLHVLARADIKSLADLAGHNVSLGAPGSPAAAIAHRVLAARNIDVKEVPLDLDNALDGLSTGDIDAVFVLAPQPFARLKSLPDEGLHLLAVASATGDGPDLTPATVAADAYPALKADAATPTLSVAVAAATNPHSAHPRQAAVVLAALTERARKTLAAQTTREMRSVAIDR